MAVHRLCVFSSPLQYVAAASVLITEATYLLVVAMYDDWGNLQPA